MRTIDLTQTLEKKKHSRVAYITMYLNGQYFGFTGSGKMSTGISFVKTTRKGVKKNKAGRTVWWFSVENSLSKATAKVRKLYNVKLPVHGWEKARVKTYNNSETSEIVEAIQRT